MVDAQTIMFLCSFSILQVVPWSYRLRETVNICFLYLQWYWIDEESGGRKGLEVVTRDMSWGVYFHREAVSFLICLVIIIFVLHEEREPS